MTYTCTLFSCWLSTESLTSPRAIPIYLLLAFWLLCQLPSILERLFTRTATRTTSAWVVPAETRHARFLPTESQHAFRYNILYLALRLDKLEARKLDTGHAFAWKGPALQPEFVDESALAQKQGVTPSFTASGDGSKHQWKAKMRAAERIERRRLEEKRGRNDRYTWSFTGLHPEAYLHTHLPLASSPADDAHPMTEPKAKWITRSILLKLAYELRERGFLSTGPQDEVAASGKDWRQELGHVWTVTMPSIVGIAGINPLSVHYCYRPHGFGKVQVKSDDERRGDFWLAVLEVHNTFSERHIYVLEAGQNEDDITSQSDGGSGTRRAGYDHQWTFPRSFHVSPFNDRGGFYRLFLKEPFAATAEPSAFVLGIRLLLLVEEADNNSAAPGARPIKLVKKMMATVDSVSPTPSSSAYVGRSVRPLSAATLYAAILRQPFDLFLTFVRILWQAGKLHFQKRLDAFGRPDIVQLSEPSDSKAAAYDGEGLPPAVNRIQPHRDASWNGSNASVGLVYPEAGWREKVAKNYICTLITRRIQELEEEGHSWSVDIESTDPADPGIHIASAAKGNPRKLKFYTRSYGVYVDLMTYRPPRLALLLGSIVGRRWGVSSRSEFDVFFPPTPPLCAVRGVRKRQFDFLLGHVNREHALAVLNRFDVSTSANHKGRDDGSEQDGWKVTLALWLGYMAAVGEEKAFAWLGARYVAGTEPWTELHRGLDYIESLQEAQQLGNKSAVADRDSRLGSVYHR